MKRLITFLIAGLIVASTTGCRISKVKPATPQTGAYGEGVTPVKPGTTTGGTALENGGVTNTTPVDDSSAKLTSEFGSGAEGLGGLNANLGEGDRSILQPVYFGFDKSAIDGAERAKVEAAATYLKANPTARVILEGHCDWRGTAEYNLGLGDRRSGNVKTFLLTLGIEESRITTKSLGAQLAAANAAGEATTRDRRVDFAVLK